jgi:DNA-binding ferritin-like protein
VDNIQTRSQRLEEIVMDIERLGELDTVTQDVLTGVPAGLEKQWWMLSAEQH